MTHELPALPYPKNALEPIMSAETIEWHYGKHHKGYVDKLNQLIRGTEFENANLEEIILRAKGPIFNNAAQAWNHTFFWNSLFPERQQPSGAFKDAIEKEYGSLEAFKNQFIDAANGVFGSGWAWLVKNEAQGRSLEIVTTSNAENPIRVGKTPLLTCDLWEHAYYIDYRSDRAKYIQSIWQAFNWKFAAQNYEGKAWGKAVA